MSIDSKDIQVSELKSKMDGKETYFLLDVRETFEHAMYNIGGTLIPLNTLPQALDRLQDYRNSEIIVYCRSGMRSNTAKEFLLQNGFSNVRNLIGGVLAWQGAGY